MKEKEKSEDGEIENEKGEGGRESGVNTGEAGEFVMLTNGSGRSGGRR